MSNIQKIDSTKTLSEIVVHGNTIYLAGQVADDDSLDMLGQTRQVLANIDERLAKVGSDKSKLLSAQIFIKDLAQFDIFNAEWTAWIAGNVPPTRATVQANLVNPKWLIEIVVVAAK
ncbi:MAG: RidA family protein [Moraxella sp.]|nr:RidA family protein [Moraxella sp.]